MYTKKRSVLAIVIILTIITALLMPALFAFKSSTDCVVSNNRFSLTYAIYISPILVLLVANVIPDVVFFFGNIVIIIRVHRLRNEITGRNQTSDATSQGRVTRTSVTLSLTHLLLTLPLILHSYILQRQIGSHSDTAKKVLLSLSTANFGGNILIYLATSQVFRQELHRQICILSAHRQPEIQSSVGSVSLSSRVGHFQSNKNKYTS